MSSSQNLSRRNFYTSVIAALGGLMSAVFALPAVAYLFTTPKSEDGDWVEIADVGDLRVGKPEEIVYRRTRVDGWRTVRDKATAWVVRTGSNKILAFTPECTHLGCAYHWEDEQQAFICPCHASAFSAAGQVIAGPAPRPLDRYPVRIESGKLLIGSNIEKQA